ncbi:molecular chaperone [Tropicimonas sp. IMCC34043]|uniref:TorD/DmsD family molecular chaperone n=1 Tax=Tropicimonas sp. IMCC34043 TaxID=2248760 RepID=UPI000E26ADDE|nr:molecular chaperone TorD family protein [Tropicimonas sp. IMCC34043]
MMTLTVNIDPSEVPELVFVAEWLAQQFLTPPDEARVLAARSMQGQIALQSIGTFLGQSQATDAVCAVLASGSAPAITVALQRRHVALFEGIFRRRSIGPYASLWDGTGRLQGPAVGRMNIILRALDVHLDALCTEPPDHVAVQLVALAEALRQGRPDCVAGLYREMSGWTDRFAAALIEADGAGYYGNVARLLIALLDRIAPDRPAAGDRDMAAAATSFGKDRL